MKKYLPLFVFLAITGACKKDPLTQPVFFTSTDYQTLGAYDSSGKPNNLEPQDVISSNMLSFVTNTLPEKEDLRKSNPDLLSTKEIADITVTKKSSITITFVTNGTDRRDAVAFYTYPTNNPPASAKDIKTITYIFPNAGYGTSLTPGDKVKIGTFDVGTSIGFVLLVNSWDPTTKKSKNDVVHFCSNDVLNPEVDPNLKKHAVLIKYPSENKVLVGFEDIDRTTPQCDHDFNDVMVYATVSPS